MALLLGVTSVFTVCGCGQRSEIREYTVPRETRQLLTSDVLRSQFPTIPLRWNAPASWREAEADEFSRMAWTTGPAAREARITITDLPGTAGVEPQLVRWRRQLTPPNAESDTVSQAVEQLTIGDTEATWAELDGPVDSILAAIIPYEDKLWVVRLRGATATTSEEKKTFRSFCESLSIPKAQRS